ncbi:MAG: bifunctional phosphopantothenoylcysteine decarboxylase/phosphopantothenate--cysteine ligase CoaBC [Mariprofundaceae bacterium]
MLAGKNILIGIGGGIAVYRVAELARLLIHAGATVRCVMTRSACAFVQPLTFEALTSEKVHLDLFDLTCEREMGHIQLARWADAVVIAPATANVLSKLAIGIADDLLTTVMQVCEVPVLLAPAMNTSMWGSHATQKNIALLKQRGMHTVGPVSGELACGEQGVGRLADPKQICDAILPLVTAQVLAGQHWVINAGPTLEPWDAVRLLSNRASGRLGALMAERVTAMGATTTLIAGVGTPETSSLMNRVDVETGEEMLCACEKHAANCDVFVATAAVSDFRFAEQHKGKLKRSDVGQTTVALSANRDVVAHIATMIARPKRVIAFAAEAEHHIESAKTKLQQKSVDAIVANDLVNMGRSHASGWWLTATEELVIDSSSKAEFSQKLIEHIMRL